MIVLDTNVISEITKSHPSSTVKIWLDEQPLETLFITAVTLAELDFGVAILPEGQRKKALAAALTRTVALFAERLLPFDTRAAFTYSRLAAAARAAGKGFPVPDGYIAAIAASHGFAVATRDVAPFLAGGVAVVNPWEEG